MSAEGVTVKGEGQLRVLLDALLPAKSTPVAVSDGASPEVRAAVADRSTVWCPVVRGATVWAAAHAEAAVVESPNWLGRVEIPSRRPQFGARHARANGRADRKA